MTKQVKILLAIAIPLVVIFMVAFGLMIHFLNFPTWTKEVKDMAMDYLSSNEEILAQYGENARFTQSGMSYNTETRNSVVKIKVNGDTYAVTVDCVNDEFIVRGHEKQE